MKEIRENELREREIREKELLRKLLEEKQYTRLRQHLSEIGRAHV